MSVPAYHIGVLKGYLSGQGAPADIFVAAEALYIAAIQGPLRDDALAAINLVAEAAEKLLRVAVAETPIREPSPVQKTAAVDHPDEPELPSITRRALEMANSKAIEVTAPADQPTDAAKIEEFLEARDVTTCPPLYAAGSDHEAVIDTDEPKKRKAWSDEARAAASERMKARQASKRAVRLGEAQAPSVGGA